MGKSKKFDQFDFLELFYQEMLAKGQPENLIRLSVNPKMAEDINENLNISLTENSLQKMADICLANSWVTKTTLGGSQYINLQLTTVGLGVVISKRKQTELLNKKSLIKKASDFIVEHRGLLILLGSIIAVASFLINHYGSKSGGQ